MTSVEKNTEHYNKVEEYNNGYPARKVFCLLWLIYVSWFIVLQTLFYVPILVLDKLFLKQYHVNAFLACGSLFVIVIFVVFNLASEYIAEKTLLLGIFLTEAVPVSILFIFSLMWNAVPGNLVYLLILYTFCGLSTLPYILCCSLLSKITSQRHASFYPSLALAIVSLAAISVRCISGLIFTQEVMEIYSCVCVLVWLFSFLWLCFEYRGLPDYHFEH